MLLNEVVYKKVNVLGELIVWEILYKCYVIMFFFFLWFCKYYDCYFKLLVF